MCISKTPFHYASKWKRKSQLKANHFKSPTPSINVESDTYSGFNHSSNYPYTINHNHSPYEFSFLAIISQLWSPPEVICHNYVVKVEIIITDTTRSDHYSQLQLTAYRFQSKNSLNVQLFIRNNFLQVNFSLISDHRRQFGS